jgi:hypothetical protein
VVSGKGDGGSGPAVEVSTPPSDYRGTQVHDPYPLPDESFTDTSGEPYAPAEDADAPVTLVFFGYTHCPDVCNIVLANVASALRGAPSYVGLTAPLPTVRHAAKSMYIAYGGTEEAHGGG